MIQRIPTTFPFFSGAYAVAAEKMNVMMEKRMKKNVSNARPWVYIVSSRLERIVWDAIETVWQYCFKFFVVI